MAQRSEGAVAHFAQVAALQRRRLVGEFRRRFRCRRHGVGGDARVV